MSLVSVFNHLTDMTPTDSSEMSWELCSRKMASLFVFHSCTVSLFSELCYILNVVNGWM